MTKQIDSETDFESMSKDGFSPPKEWWNLKESCRRKGLNYKTACNKKYLQPNNGIPDAYVGGRKVWHRTTIEVWIKKTDEEMLKKGE